MAMTKKFVALHAAIVANKLNENAIEAGTLAVKACYSNQDAEMVLALLNDTPQHVRKAFATWFRRYGVIVNEPAYGTMNYSVGDGAVLVTKKQHKVFDDLAHEPADVLKQEIVERKAPKKPDLTGLAADRVQKKIEALIKAMKKAGDEEGACLLNDVWCAKRDAAIAEYLEPLKLAA